MRVDNKFRRAYNSAMFGKKDKATANTPAPEDIVRLKPVLGIRPGVYLSIIYAAAILVLLFFLLVFPGLRAKGALVSFESEPWGAAVRINDVYQGTTPCKIYLLEGGHVFTFVLPGFENSVVRDNIKGRVFASRFFPKTQLISAALSASNPQKALALAASEFAEWSLTGEPSAIYQIPLSLSLGAYRTGPAAGDPQAYSVMNDTLRAAARFAANRGSQRDLLRAKFLLDNKGNSPSPLSLIHSLHDIVKFFDENPASARLLRESLPSGSALNASAWLQNDTRNNGSGLTVSGIQGSARVGTLDFQGLRLTGEAGTPSAIWVAVREVSAADWEAFLAENPRWRQNAMDALLAGGLITGDYLAGADLPGFPAPSIPGVSWHAARAYCEWLSSKLGGAWQGYAVRLPSENEWEAAARFSQNGRSSLGGFSGGLWEWCEDPYSQLGFIKAPQSAVEAVGSPMRAVRGGCWIIPASQLSIELRGSLSPETCSPFVSFRPVIAQAQPNWSQLRPPPPGLPENRAGSGP